MRLALGEVARPWSVGVGAHVLSGPVREFAVVSALTTIRSSLPPKIHLGLLRFSYRLTHPRRYNVLQEKRRIVTTDTYSYKPFDDSRSIFVHIPKCAGISVARSLYGNLAGGHATLADYFRVFKPAEILSYFKFTIVRNPWDRLVSAYHFLRAGGFVPADKHWFDGELAGYSGFEEFVVDWLNKENIWKWPHFRPQYHYLTDSAGMIKLDFHCLFENLEEDFQFVAQKIGKNCSLSKANQGDRQDYKAYYSDRTRELVSTVYEKDIALLGYSFDNSSVESQLAGRSASFR